MGDKDHRVLLPFNTMCCSQTYICMPVKIYKITERNNKLVAVLSSGERRKGIGLSVNVTECFNFICNILLLLYKGKKRNSKD